MLTMRLVTIWLMACAMTFPLLTAGWTSQAVARNKDSLDAKVASVLPTPEEERWLTIPWRTNLMQARWEAQQLNKPLFLWVMNGNPMGCT